MSLVPTEEQQMLRDSAAEYFRDNASVEAFRQLRGTERPVNSDIWPAMTDFGWPAIMIPEQFGGLGFGISGLGMIAIEAGKNLTVSPLFTSATLSAHALLQCRASETRDGLVRSIALGESLVALALDEGGRFSPSSGAFEALENEQGYLLSGTKTFVAEGSYADKILVLANLGSRPTLFEVDATHKGIKRQKRELIDRRDYADIEFEQVQVSKSAKFDWTENEDQHLASMVDVGALMAAAELYGCSLEAFERTCVYLGDRVQFGKRIGSFQALQHRMAHAYTQMELLKSVLSDALHAVENDRKDASLAVSHAKTLANDTASLVTREAIQMHGGIGITDELDIGLFYKRARALKTQFGDSNYHKDRFARLNGY